MTLKDANDYLVEDADQLVDSILKLDALLKNDSSFAFFDHSSIRKRIKQGKNFVCYRFKGKDEALKFLPSRTVGYRFSLWNSGEPINLAASNTNSAIKSVLGEDCSVNPKLNEEFEAYCKKLNIKPIGEGPHPRKFWGPIDIEEDFWLRTFNSSTSENSGEISERERLELEEELSRLSELEQEEEVNQTRRRFQGKLRSSLLKTRKACQLSGIATSELLVASHIKPWSKCSHQEKLDPNNVLLLSANFDKLFDQFLISFTDEGKILISECLTPEECKKIGLRDGLSLNPSPSPEMKEYLKEHRKNLKIKKG